MSNMFEVVPENYEEVEDVAKEVTGNNKVNPVLLKEFKSRAEDEGFALTLIEETCDNLSKPINSYDEFCIELQNYIDNKQRKKLAEEEKQHRIKMSIQLELESLKQVPDISTYLKDMIMKYYNTSAVDTVDVLRESDYVSDGDLKLDMYEEIVYSVILQIKKPWVSDIIGRCLAKWNNETVLNYIDGYLNETFADSKLSREEQLQRLFDALPDVIQNEDSPDEYKWYKAVQLIRQEDNPDIDLDIDKDIDSVLNCTASIENNVDNGSPYEAACNVPDKNIAEKASAKVGELYGKFVLFTYSLEDSFSGAVKNSMGDYYDTYVENRDKIAEKRAIKKKEAEEKKKEEKEAKELEQDRAVFRENLRIKSNPNVSVRNNKYIDKQPYNYAPPISTTVIVILIHCVTMLLFLLLFKRSTAIAVCFGLALSLFGFFKKKENTKDGIKLIAIGYAVSILAIILL